MHLCKRNEGLLLQAPPRFVLYSFDFCSLSLVYLFIYCLLILNDLISTFKPAVALHLQVVLVMKI